MFHIGFTRTCSEKFKRLTHQDVCSLSSCKSRLFQPCVNNSVSIDIRASNMQEKSLYYECESIVGIYNSSGDDDEKIVKAFAEYGYG